MTESEVFESVTGSGSSDFATLVEILNRHGKWCLIGGLALNSYVEPVYTLDADVVVASSELPEIKDELIAVGFEVEEFPYLVNAQMPGSALRIQLSLDPRYQGFLDHAQSSTVLGLQARVASLQDVVRGKIWAWRDQKRRASKRRKDESDLLRILETYPETRDLMPDEISAQVAE